MTLEELQEQFVQLQEQFNTVQSDNENMKTQLVEKNNDITKLQELNQKLFLRVTTEQPKEEKQNDNTEIKEYVGDNIFKVLSQKDINKIKEIMNGDDE